MRVVEFQVSNYKSLRDTQRIGFTAGFNVVVGRNNAGKTALVEALELRFGNKPHQSLATRPRPTMPITGHSAIEVLFTMSRDELHDLVGTLAPVISLPTREGYQQGAFENFLFRYAGESTFELSALFEDGQPTEAELKGLGPSVSVRRTSGSVFIELDAEHHPTRESGGTSSAPGGDTLPIRLAQAIRDRVYAFRAERLNVGEIGSGFDQVLQPDASNLARVLNHLQANTSRFRRFNDAVKSILPDITQITVKTTEQNTVRILVWTIDPETEREDLAMPLAESGTGIGQVLAILAVILTSEYPRVILIDEPQSFLHPGAVRKLFEVMRREVRHDHQYIVTTHSSTAVTAADPTTILLVRKSGAESTIERINPDESDQMRLFLAEIGARLGDVFGADDISWVEGQTEERCFPLILRRVTDTALLGTEIIGVRATGELEGKQARAAFEIYARLISGRGLLPPAVGFIFDREGRSDKDQQDLRRQGGGQVHFLPRRLYENYLLNPTAIASVANSIKEFSDGPQIEPSQVENWLESKRWLPRYFDEVPDEQHRTDEFWRRDVHGAKLLADLFTDLSGKRVPYEKVAYGVALTEWLLEHSPADLKEVAALLSGVLKTSRRALRGSDSV